MASRVYRTYVLALVWSCLLVGHVLAGATVTEVKVELQMERWVPKGGSVLLRCIHDVPTHLLDKVVFLRHGVTIFQYIKDRKPPYRNFTTPGAILNIALASKNSIVLQSLEFAASGVYSCEVSLQTPIFTKSSSEKQLTVIQPQKHQPRIEVINQQNDYDSTLQFNCTSAPALPAPHITWFVNGKKLDDTVILSNKYRLSNNGRHIFHQRNRTYSNVGDHHSDGTVSDIPHCHSSQEFSKDMLSHRRHRSNLGDLWISVSTVKLKTTEDIMYIECVSTIPEFRGLSGQYADLKNDSVIVENIPPTTSTENSLGELVLNTTLTTNFSSSLNNKHTTTFIILLITLRLLVYL